MVNCGICGREYDVYNGILGRGDGCACAVDGDAVVGHYGSEYDLQVFRWTENSPIKFEAEQNVCDNCIKHWLKQGWIVEASEFFEAVIRYGDSAEVVDIGMDSDEDEDDREEDDEDISNMSPCELGSSCDLCTDMKCRRLKEQLNS